MTTFANMTNIFTYVQGGKRWLPRCAQRSNSSRLQFKVFQISCTLHPPFDKNSFQGWRWYDPHLVGGLWRQLGGSETSCGKRVDQIQDNNDGQKERDVLQFKYDVIVVFLAATMTINITLSVLTTMVVQGRPRKMRQLRKHWAPPLRCQGGYIFIFNGIKSPQYYPKKPRLLVRATSTASHSWSTLGSTFGTWTSISTLLRCWALEREWKN